jgi:hypothetical protein
MLLALAAQSALYPIALAYPLLSMLSKPLRGGLVFGVAFMAISGYAWFTLGPRWPTQTWGTM